jgi:hypothetical protein
VQRETVFLRASAGGSESNRMAQQPAAVIKLPSSMVLVEAKRNRKGVGLGPDQPDRRLAVPTAAAGERRPMVLILMAGRCQ